MITHTVVAPFLNRLLPAMYPGRLPVLRSRESSGMLRRRARL
jgi:hypothetical protein